MPLGFIGLGNLGKAMAARLAGQSVDLILWNRTIDKANVLVGDLAALGYTSSVQVAESPADVVANSEIVFLNLFDSVAVLEVLTGSRGVLSGNCRGKIIVDTSTNHPQSVTTFYDLCAGAGATYLESPVLGSVIPASQGSLTALVSGDHHSFEEVRSYLDKLAKTIFYLERPTLATKMKLVNNLVLGAFMATIAEAVACGEACGMQKERILEILLAGAGNSGVLSAKRQKLTEDDYSPHFSVAAIHKDLGYLSELAQQVRVTLAMSAQAEQLFKEAERMGFGQSDLSAVYRIMKRT